MSTWLKAAGALFILLAVTTSAAAQSTIAGTVRDTSGAVLPGVTVEATSDALIEKTRTAVTDGSGQYRIVDLRPGLYTVTFTLPGFSTYRRDGLELPAEFVATVNADLRVGALEETITVTGESPIVDVQSAKRQQTIDSEMIQSIPTAKGYSALAVLIPSMIQSGGGASNVQLSPGMVVFGGRGGRGNEGRAQVDGLNTGAATNGGGVSGYRQDIENAQEVAITTSGSLGESEVGGPVINIVPRTGGNAFAFHYFFTGLSGGMQASNFTPKLQAAGLRRPAKTNHMYDTSFAAGGPIVRDRLWFFGMGYYRGSSNDVPGMYYNKNAGDPTKWTYEADLDRPAVSEGRGPIQPNLRLTWQVSSRDRLSLFWDEQISNNSLGAGSATASPETSGFNHGFQRVQQIKYTSTLGPRVLVESGIGTYLSNWNGRERPDNDRGLIQVTEQCAGAAGCPNNGGIANLVYRGQNWNADWLGSHFWYASATFVSGTHSAKFGYQGAFYVDNRFPQTNDHTLTYRVNNGVPNQLTQTLLPYRTRSRTRYNAFFAQDQWTRGRLTLAGALRYDNPWSYYPEQQIGPTRFLPEPLLFPKTKGVLGYHDLSPRVGVAYDLFGNAKTALKFNMGRYLEAAVNNNGNYSALLPASRIDTSQSRTWTDANGNFTPDCDLMSGAQQNLIAAGGDLCGAWPNQNFGKNVYSLSYAEKILEGWGTRPADWQIGVTLQQEVLPRVSVEVGYTRRWLQNFTVTDNRAVSPEDFDQFSITAPLDPRLPNGGGYVISGLYNVKPEKFATATDNLRTYAPDYGSISQIYNGVDVNVSARLQSGLTVRAGTSTGQRRTDYCDIRAKLPEQTQGFSTGSEVPAFSPTNPYCLYEPGVTTRLTGAGSYTIPKIDVLVSGTFQSTPGEPLLANWNVTNAIAQPSLGRPLSAAGGSVVVNLLEPGMMNFDRVNQLDFRVGKILRLGGRRRANVSLDLYNALNLDTVLGYNQTFVPGGNWLVPTSVLTARTAKITVQYDF
jgi:hypothetical protein